MTDPKHTWPPPHAAHRRRGGQHRAVVVRHPRRVVSAATGLLGVVAVALAATFTPSTPSVTVPPQAASAVPSGQVPVFELPASSGVVVWPVRQVVDTDPIADTDTTSAEPTEPMSSQPPAATTTTTTQDTPEPTTEAEATTQPPAPTTTATRTHRPRPTVVATCSPGGAT